MREIARISSKIGNYHLAPHGQSLVRLYRAKPVYSKEVDRFSFSQSIKPLLLDKEENKVLYIPRVKANYEGAPYFKVFFTPYLRIFDSHNTLGFPNYVRGLILGKEKDPRSPYYFGEEVLGEDWGRASDTEFLFINIRRHDDPSLFIDEMDCLRALFYFTVYSDLTRRFPEKSYFFKHFIAASMEEKAALNYMRGLGGVDRKKALDVALASIEAKCLQYFWEEGGSKEGFSVPRAMSFEDFLGKCLPFGSGQIRKQS